jgi:hypothetical protein
VTEIQGVAGRCYSSAVLIAPDVCSVTLPVLKNAIALMAKSDADGDYLVAVFLMDPRGRLAARYECS